MSKTSTKYNYITRTAEFVSPRHPDKICDIVSDSILDEFLRKDPDARVAIEVMGGHGKLFLMGEVTSSAQLDYAEIARAVVGSELSVEANISRQSPEIARGVDAGGAGDQGVMVGYACAENSEYLPTEYILTRNLCKYLYGRHPFDGKTQITARLKYGPNGNFIDGKISHIVISWQNVSTSDLCLDLTAWLNQLPHRIKANRQTKVSINPAGDWQLGGFDADTGLTGRKLVIDNYGPRVPIGGGAFSGKDPSKVDRSAAYMARKIAIDCLQQHDAHEALVYISYAIGEKQAIDATVLLDGVAEQVNGYDLSPRGIIEQLDLRKPHYAERAKWGHFSAQTS